MRAERCPFCDSARIKIVRYNQRGEHFLVQCCNCGARGPFAFEKVDAVGRWNIRREFRSMSDAASTRTNPK